jgi:hypothetical protein
MLFLRAGDYFRIAEEDMGTAESCYQVSLQMIEFIGTPIHQADALARIALCQEYNSNLDAAATNLSRARARLTRVGIAHQVEFLDRKIASLGATNKELLTSFDALPPPTLIGQPDFTYSQ